MEKKKNIIIVISSCIVLFIALTVLLVVNIKAEKKEKNLIKYTQSTTTGKLIDKTFKGYKAYTIDEEVSYSLPLEKYYEFVYTANASGDFDNEYKGNVYNYTLEIVDGELLFRESLLKDNDMGYEETNMTYEFRGEGKITSFLVVKSNEVSNYALLVVDEKNNVYVYENEGNERAITKIIANIKKVKTLTKVKRVGYYNYSNVPTMRNKGYDLIYEDEAGTIRYLLDKNGLFYDDAYYRYLGSDMGSEFIYVLKDGLMRFSLDERVLNDGNSNIYYRGSFYTYDEDKQKEDVYIIGKDAYLYRISDLQIGSLPLINRVSVEKIKRIGTQVIRDENNFATSMQKVLVEFADGELLNIDNTYAFELLG